MKILFATALLLAVAASGVYSQACHLREIDLCMAVSMFHYQSNGIPADDDRINEWCETIQEMSDCIGNFSAKCLSPMQRETFGLFSGSDEHTKQLCVEGSELRARYLEHAECLAEGSEQDDFKGYMRDLQVIIEKLFKVPYKQRFSLMCCGFRRFLKQIEDGTERRCGAAAVDMVRSIMEMMTTQLPETICQSFDPESEQCKNQLPAPGTQPGTGEDRPQLVKLLETITGDN